MSVELNAHEARVLGVLIEKAFTTPEQYPLSLNGCTLGCNQKSNRHPVVDFSEAEVTVALQGLLMKHLAGSSFPAGSRVEKWRHNAKEHLELGDQELALLAELLLRGPQTLAELRARASRMRAVTPDELGRLVERLRDKGYAERRPPASGSRTERLAQTLAASLSPDGQDEDEPPEPATPRATLERRVGELEERLQRLEGRLGELCRRLGEDLSGAEGPTRSEDAGGPGSRRP